MNDCNGCAAIEDDDEEYVLTPCGERLVRARVENDCLREQLDSYAGIVRKLKKLLREANKGAERNAHLAKSLMYDMMMLRQQAGADDAGDIEEVQEQITDVLYEHIYACQPIIDFVVECYNRDQLEGSCPAPDFMRDHLFLLLEQSEL